MSKAKFRKLIVPVGPISLTIGAISAVIAVFFAVISIGYHFNLSSSTLTSTQSHERSLFTLYVSICSGVLSIVEFVYWKKMNNHRKDRITREHYEVVKKYGFIEREYTLNNAVVKTYVVLLVKKKHNFTQVDYDDIWNKFEYFIQNECGLEKFNYIMQRIQDRTVKNEKEYKQLLIQFFEYIEKNHQEYKGTRIYIMPNSNFPDYNDKHRLLDIVYDNGKIVYFGSVLKSMNGSGKNQKQSKDAKTTSEKTG